MFFTPSDSSVLYCNSNTNASLLDVFPFVCLYHLAYGFIFRLLCGGSLESCFGTLQKITQSYGAFFILL